MFGLNLNKPTSPDSKYPLPLPLHYFDNSKYFAYSTSFNLKFGQYNQFIETITKAHSKRTFLVTN